jgi:hypothetical protein
MSGFLAVSPKETKVLPDMCFYLDILSSGRFVTSIAARRCVASIFDALHMLHEESRLAIQSRGSNWTRRIGSLLLHVSEQNSPFMVDYEDHYQRLLGSTRCQSSACDMMASNTFESSRLSAHIMSPCIMTCLDSILHLQTNGFRPEDAQFGMAGYNDLTNSHLNGICSSSWTVLRLYRVLFDTNINGADSCLAMTLLDEGITNSSQLQDELPISLSYPLLEAIYRCRLNPPQIGQITESMSGNYGCGLGGARSFYELIGRNDLAALSINGSQSSFDNRAKSAELSPITEDIDKDGLAVIEDYSSMIFPEDNRIREAARLLRSSRTLFLRVPRPPELSDHDYERTKQEKLLLLCRRSIALCWGRGMITLGTSSIQSSEQLAIPNIVLAGRVPPTNGTLALGKHEIDS